RPRQKTRAKRSRATRRSGAARARVVKVRQRRAPTQTPETAARVARISKLAEQIFGDEAKAARWLAKPKEALNGQTPLKFLADDQGANIIEEMLYRIDAGILP